MPSLDGLPVDILVAVLKDHYEDRHGLWTLSVVDGGDDLPENNPPRDLGGVVDVIKHVVGNGDDRNVPRHRDCGAILDCHLHPFPRDHFLESLLRKHSRHFSRGIADKEDILVVLVLQAKRLLILTVELCNGARAEHGFDHL